MSTLAVGREWYRGGACDSNQRRVHPFYGSGWLLTWDEFWTEGALFQRN